MSIKVNTHENYFNFLKENGNLNYAAPILQLDLKMVLFESFGALVSKIRYSLFMLSGSAFKSVKNGPSVVLYLKYIDKHPTPFSVDLK